MKVKHIITTLGAVLGGLVVAQGASATVTYTDKADVQFTFNSILSLSLDDDEFLIDNLAPGNSSFSNQVTATVNTNSAAGYTLSATVGDATHTTTALTPASGNDSFSMISATGVLSSGEWGYTLTDTPTATTQYSALDTSTSTVLNATKNAAGDPPTSSSYAGTSQTGVRIGAYAKPAQLSGTYQNVMNFTAVANMYAPTVRVAAGANVASVRISKDGTSYGSSAAFTTGTTVDIIATCNSTYTFSGWGIDYDYGTIADRTATGATTTYTVGGGDVTLTAYCYGGGS